MLETVLENNGYFGSKASYELRPLKNPKIANVIYDVDVTRPYLLDSIIYLEDTDPARHFIDSMARKSKYLVRGERFCVDSLKSERVRIANAMRNKGYYYFRPEYIEYLADTLLSLCRGPQDDCGGEYSRHSHEEIPHAQHSHHRDAAQRQRHRDPDTMQTDKGELIVYRPARLRPDLVPGCITFRKGKIFLRARHGPHPDTSFTPRHIQQHPDAGCPGRHLSRMRRTRSLYRLPVRPSDGSIDRGRTLTSTSNSYLGPSGTRFQREQQQCVRRCRKTQCPAQGAATNGRPVRDAATSSIHTRWV